MQINFLCIICFDKKDFMHYFKNARFFQVFSKM
jgi:hypothetical protein